MIAMFIQTVIYIAPNLYLMHWLIHLSDFQNREVPLLRTGPIWKRSSTESDVREKLRRHKS